LGAEYQMTVGLDALLSHTKVFLFSRAGGRDFNERDRVVLDFLRPQLARLYEAAQARGVAPPLTDREREILELVVAGKTNAEIAEAMWIAPGTVRKHLENVYEKLGVHSRTAAVATLNGD
jgi:DNA-binding CsgD family transcriptional regulator